MAKKQSDNLKALAAIARSPKPMISIAMGELGLPSRILGTAWGSKITFGGLAVGLESAPGQTTARDLYEIYRVNELTKQTAIYGLIGDPVNKSEGYRLHNRAFAATGLDAVYIPFQCSEADDVLGPLTGELPIRGLSVTMPHKRAALEWATLRSDSANAIGAANTLTLTEHGWRADNTDCDAVAEAVARHALIFNQQLSGQPALVLGIGGAARAVGVALQNLGCRVHIAGRCSERTADTAKEMGWDAAGWDETSTRPWRVVANATSLGMTPHENATPFPRENWKSGMIAFESVYHPRRTKFLQDAAEAGVATVEGMEMFIRQAARQFSIWTGAPLPESAASPYGIDIYPFVIEGVA